MKKISALILSAALTGCAGMTKKVPETIGKDDPPTVAGKSKLKAGFENEKKNFIISALEYLLKAAEKREAYWKDQAHKAWHENQELVEPTK